ncbi:MAG TPA: ATP-binding protein [Candidatus Methylomirabilis sp.]|nr:ATP-binding protein [Candidatus Methylomirabilis sp.]
MSTIKAGAASRGEEFLATPPPSTAIPSTERTTGYRGWRPSAGAPVGQAAGSPESASQVSSLLRTRSIAQPHAGRTLIRQFALLSLLVIGLITLALSLVISYNLRKDLLDREWGTTADFIRTEALQHLSPADFVDPTTPSAQAHFQNLYHGTVTMPEIVRVKIYDATLAVVWSDEPRLRGERFLDNPHLVQSLAGRTTVNLEFDTDAEKKENVYERTAFTQLVEVYVPVIFPGSSRVVGVVETYKMPTQVIASIRRGQITVVTTAVAGGILLYLSLFWIVRRAGRRLEEQHRDLAQRTQELIAANEELRAVQAQLLEAERLAAIGEVVTAVAHGIRNPLANIRASAQVAGLDCRDCQSPGTAPKNLTNIMNEVDRLETRLKELLQFVRPADRPCALLDLNTVLEEALQLMAGRLAKASLRLTKELAPDLPPFRGNAMLVEQVFLSLLGNGVEALPDSGGTITVRTGTTQGPDRTLRIFAHVQDSGGGIPAEHLSRIFDPFYTTKAQGTGLGLAIARKFTEALGGSIEVSNPPEGGAAFRVTFPPTQEV